MNPGTSSTLRKRIAAVLATVCLTPSGFSESPKPQHAKVSLVTEHTSLSPGASEWIGVRFELEPGWHIYWVNPGDSGEPPKVNWNLPNGIQAGVLQFPAPERIPDHGMTDYGYEGEVVLLSKLTLSPGFSSNKTDIGADLRYLVCREVCVPGKEHVSTPLEVGRLAAPTTNQAHLRVPATPDEYLVVKAEQHLPRPLPQNMHASAISEKDSFLVTISGEFYGLGIMDFLPEDAQVIENGTKPSFIDGGHFKSEVRMRLKKSEQLDHPPSQIRGLLVMSHSKHPGVFVKAYETAIPVVDSKTASRARSQQ